MNTYKRYRFPPDIISYAVWLYYGVAHRELIPNSIWEGTWSVLSTIVISG
jgi:hypothetical protein